MLVVATHLVLMAIAVGIYLGAGSFPGRHLGPAGPGFFPRLVAAGLFCLSAWGLLLRRTDAEGLRGQVSIPPRVLLGMGASVLYILLMYFVGYFPSTLLFVFVIMWLVRDGAPAWRLGAESAALTGFAFLVFRVIVKTYLPLGIFFE